MGLFETWVAGYPEIHGLIMISADKMAIWGIQEYTHVYQFFARSIFFEPYPVSGTKVRADKQSLEVKSDGISQQVQETFVMLGFLAAGCLSLQM